MLESKEVIINVEMINAIQNVVNYQSINKEMIAKQLHGFMKELSKDETVEGLEYTEFLLEELQREKPKLFIIESLLTPFRKAFVGTGHAAEARDIANNLWRYVKIEHPSERCI